MIIWPSICFSAQTRGPRQRCLGYALWLSRTADTGHRTQERPGAALALVSLPWAKRAHSFICFWQTFHKHHKNTRFSPSLLLLVMKKQPPLSLSHKNVEIITQTNIFIVKEFSILQVTSFLFFSFFKYNSFYIILISGWFIFYVVLSVSSSLCFHL